MYSSDSAGITIIRRFAGMPTSGGITIDIFLFIGADTGYSNIFELMQGRPMADFRGQSRSLLPRCSLKLAFEHPSK
ncbi:hypothetical protein TSAR_005562 [Trichomalopsis sarcophagae]|uniref:Uncharacterized protein n=1 Tax=Trichomalopsis sarcophagae TaxID=543379 RepID=A0A232EI02_9HYME|nr:hypothetical protein TSAR_005562 [Trichomalopsis sarcophagae]